MSNLSGIPLGVNPNGDPPNFTHGASLQPAVLASGVVLIMISLTFVLIRVGTSLYNSHKLLLDDYLCVFGEAFGLAYWFVFYEGQIKQGIDKHSWDIPVTAITPRVIKTQSVAQLLAPLAQPMVKCAILAFYIRLFGTVRWVRLFCYGWLVVIPCVYAAYVIALFVLCIPRPGHAWDSAFVQRCNQTAPAKMTIGICNVIFDIAIFAMPFFIISKLNVNRQRRRALAAVFLVGFLTVVSSIVGLAFRILVQNGRGDTIWDGTNIGIAATAEIFGTVIVGCTPSLWSFWFNIFTKTKLYSSLRSTIWSRPRPAQSASNLRAAKHSYDEACYCEQCRQTKRLQTPTSSMELVEPIPPNSTIQKQTVIVQNVSGETPDLEMQRFQNGNRTSQNKWRANNGSGW